MNTLYELYFDNNPEEVQDGLPPMELPEMIKYVQERQLEFFEIDDLIWDVEGGEIIAHSGIAGGCWNIRRIR
jgi:hypothetical protein